LQSRKNGLGSAEIGHVVLEGGLEDVIQKFLSVFHHFLTSLKNLTTDSFFNDDKNHSSSNKKWAEDQKKNYRKER
jgi:hypothetical protein